MKTSNKGIAMIKGHEGFRTRAYRCPAGVWTIGYGHTRSVNSGDVITESQAEKLLRGDLETAERAILAHKLPLSQNQFDALVSFVFNVGTGNFSRSSLLKKAKVNVNDASIATEFRKWNKARNPKTGKLEVLPGLVRRREDELKLYFTK